MGEEAKIEIDCKTCYHFESRKKLRRKGPGKNTPEELITSYYCDKYHPFQRQTGDTFHPSNPYKCDDYDQIT